MPSSKDRRRIEVPVHLYDRLKQIADVEDRTVTSLINEILHFALQSYQPTWVPSAYLDRFDGATRQMLAFAREEALRLNHNYIGTEHLLLGLLREEQGIAAQVLRRLWIDLDKVREAVERFIGRGKEPLEGDIDYVPRVRKVLALAVDEAQRLGHDHVGTEHVLLGIAREGEGIAAGILHGQYGVLGKVREQTLAHLSQAEANTSPPDTQDQADGAPGSEQGEPSDRHDEAATTAP
jgi:ATP-dependent Clp protease ATP-binding subunit ClpC